LATVLILATALIASANRYSIGDASGQLYVQSYTRFTSPSFALNTTGNQYSCQSGNHINESMWFFTKASHPVPLNGQAYGSWIEVGYIAGYDIGNPSQYGCDIGYYYADYPYGQYGPSTIYVPMGVNTTTNNYWLRFVSNQIGSQGAYAIINGNEYTHFNDQTCCSDRIDVGLEFSVDYPNGASWYASPTDDTPLDYYDLNWNVSYWRGCTVAGFPNNCSHQDTNMGGWWPNVWNDYQNWFTAGQ
jgi:uncharacterized protein YfiM (DUF2279 family)